MTNGAHSAAGVATYRVMRELGARSPRSHAAIREPNELVVTYRYARAGDAKVSSNVATYVGNDGAITLGSDAMANLVRDAKCLEKNWHPNIARVRHVDVAAEELIVATELVDGATMQDLFTFAAAKRPAGPASAGGETFLPLPVVVRILVDVLAGLHGLHGLRDAASGTLGTIHGALCPANIVVGKDGVARIVNTLRPRPVQVGASSEAVGYGAPEALDVGGTSDLRADVHAVGVILWEALTGRRLYEDADPVRILARQREEEIELPTFPAGSPFAGLADVVLHALAFDPSLRFKTAAEMGAALRAIAGSRIATGSVVAAQVAELAGERIRARRIELDPSSSGTRRRASLTPMRSAPAVAAETPAPARAAMAKAAASSGYDAPAPMSKRATVPPAALAELDRLGARVARAEDEAPPPPSVREELSLRDLMAAAPPLHESAMVANTPSPSASAIPAAPAAPAATAAAIPRAGSVPRIALGARPVAAAGNAPRPAPAKRAPNAPAPGAAPVARSMPPKPPMSMRPPAAAAAANAHVQPHPAEENAPTLVTTVNEPPHPAEENAPTVVVAPESKRGPESEPLDDPPTLQATVVMPVQTAPLAPEPPEPPEPPVDNTVKLLAPTPALAPPAEAPLGASAAPEWKRTPDRTFAPVTDESVAANASDESPMGMFSAPPPPPLRKMSPAVIAGAVVIALVGAGLALRALLSDTPAPPVTTAATVRPSAEVPSPVVTTPPAPPPTATPTASETATAEAASAETENKAREEAEAKAKAEAEAKSRDEAAAKPSDPTPPANQAGTTPRPTTPRPIAPMAPGRPKKPYEPSGI